LRFWLGPPASSVYATGQLEISEKKHYWCSKFLCCLKFFFKMGYFSFKLLFYWTKIFSDKKKIFLTIFWQHKIQGACRITSGVPCRLVEKV